MKLSFRDEDVIRSIRPWIHLSTYIPLFGFLIVHLQDLKNGFDFVLSVFKFLLYAIVSVYVLNLPVRHTESFLSRHAKQNSLPQRKKRVIFMIFMFLPALILIIPIGSVILPSIIDSLVSPMGNLAPFFTNIVKNVDEALAYFHTDYRIGDITQVEQFIQMPWERIVINITNLLSDSANGILSSVTGFVPSFAVGFTDFMLSLYLFNRKENFMRQMRRVTAVFLGYGNSEVIFCYATRVNWVFFNFIGGQLMEAYILWVLYYIFMQLLQFPYPELICTPIIVCSMVPVSGSMLAVSVGVIMMLSKDSLQSAWLIIFYQVLSYFEDNVIYPRVVGNSVGLPGLWVLSDIFVFGDLQGVFGMIMAVPTTVCLYVFFTEYMNRRLRKQRLIVAEGIVYQKDEEEHSI